METALKKIALGLVAVAVLGGAWYLASPLWRVKVKDDPSPLKTPPTINDRLEQMPLSERRELERAVEAQPEKIIVTNQPMPPAPKLLAEAPFVTRAHEVSGKALIIESDGKKTLRFEDFRTVNGPDLRIYLSSNLGVGDALDLGPIQATKGNVNYELPEDLDVGRYTKVLVWCRAFSVLFGYAELASVQ